MSRKKIWGILIVLGLLVLSYTTKAQDAFGFLDHNAHYDSRGFASYTLNTLWKSNKVQWFSLTNFNSAPKALDFNAYYTELHLSFDIDKEAKFALNQAFISSSTGSEALLYALQINWHRILRIPKSKNYQFRFFTNFHAFGFTQNVSKFQILPQIEYVYWLSKTMGKKEREIYMNGFADQNILNGKHSWVTEHQLGLEILKNFYAVAEYRYNQYLIKENNGLALGLQYIMRF